MARYFITGRKWRDNAPAFRAALAANKERGDKAMAEALEACAALGRSDAKRIHGGQDMRENPNEPTERQIEYIKELLAGLRLPATHIEAYTTFDRASIGIERLQKRLDEVTPIKDATRASVFIKMKEQGADKDTMYAAAGITTLSKGATERDAKRCLRFLDGTLRKYESTKPPEPEALVIGDLGRWLVEQRTEQPVVAETAVTAPVAVEPVAPAAPARPVRLVPGRDMRPRVAPAPVVPAPIAPAPVEPAEIVTPPVVAPVLPKRPVTPGRAPMPVAVTAPRRDVPIRNGLIEPRKVDTRVAYAGGYLEHFGRR